MSKRKYYRVVSTLEAEHRPEMVALCIVLNSCMAPSMCMVAQKHRSGAKNNGVLSPSGF